MSTRPTVDELLDNFAGGNREYYMTCLTNKDGLLERVCDYAEDIARVRDCEPWSIIMQVTNHGSGVSKAIYELYRRREE